MRLKLPKTLALISLLIGLSACTTNINGDFCLLYEPIYADYTNDTPETIRQIDRNNIVYEEMCQNISL